jgi:energy-coupling factor transport system permease protein
VIARLRSINPLTALAAAVLLVCVAYVVPAPAGPLAALTLALVVAGITGAGRRVAILAAAVAVPTWIFIGVMNAIVAPEGNTVRVAGIVVAPGALIPAAWIALRLCAAVAALGWVVVTTPPQRLVRALAQRGLPAWSQYLLAASLAAAPEARRRAREVLDAQRCRGLRIGGSPFARLRAALPLAGPLMVSLVTDSERHAIALDARAFDAQGKRTSLTDVADPNDERTLRTVMWGVTVALIVWGLLRGLLR